MQLQGRLCLSIARQAAPSKAVSTMTSISMKNDSTLIGSMRHGIQGARKPPQLPLQTVQDGVGVEPGEVAHHLERVVEVLQLLDDPLV
eukprot:3202070-Pyramimonas_sp.AAC.1